MSSEKISLSKILVSIFEFLERFTSKKYWRLKFVLILTFLSLLFSTGAFFYLPQAMKDDNWNSFSVKKEHPLTASNFTPVSHAAKKTFRLTVPLIAKFFHLNNYLVFLLQILVSICFLYFTVVLVQQMTGDNISALLAAAGMVFIYTGHAGFTDINTWFDEFAFLFLIMAMLYRNPLIIFFCLQLACWTDERALLSCGLVFIWWKLNEAKSSSFSFTSLFKLQWQSSVVVLSLFFYVALRLFLSSAYGLRTPLDGAGINTIMKNTDFMGMALWSAFEGFWILNITAMILIWHKRLYFLGFCLMVVSAIITLVAFSVFDLTRSIAYIFPVIFISVLLLKDELALKSMRKLLMLSAVVCFLFPAYYIITDVSPYILWYKPLFVRVIDFVRIYLAGH